MLRNLTVFGSVMLLCGCASTASAVIGSSTDKASRAGIIDALNGGLFSNLDDGGSSRAERMQALEAEYRALEHTPAGQTVEWKSKRSELAGEVVAAQPYRVGSQDCRTYTHTLNKNGDARTARGTACRNADGSWTPLT